MPFELSDALGKGFALSTESIVFFLPDRKRGAQSRGVTPNFLRR